MAGGQAAGGATGEREVGIEGEKKGGRGKFLEKKRFFGAIRATEGHQRVRMRKMPADDGGGLLVKQAYCFSVEKRGVAKVNPLPEATEGGVRVEGRGRQFRSHGVLRYTIAQALGSEFWARGSPMRGGFRQPG